MFARRLGSGGEFSVSREWCHNLFPGVGRLGLGGDSGWVSCGVEGAVWFVHFEGSVWGSVTR